MTCSFRIIVKIVEKLKPGLRRFLGRNVSRIAPELTAAHKPVIPKGPERIRQQVFQSRGLDTSMQIIKFLASNDPDRSPRIGMMQGSKIRVFENRAISLGEILHASNPGEAAQKGWESVGGNAEMDLDSVQLLAPIDRQEVWGAGVTYERSKIAREEESEQAATFYDRVYRADRPELFFKASPSRVVGPGQAIRVRRDSQWSVPEPELALVLSPAMRIVGYTVGNDVSARDIEGVNPLYLPQAKTYDASCALGPAITLVEAMPPLAEIKIELEIDRDGHPILRDSTPLSRMARKLEDLIAWLGRDNSFVDGVFLLTGTGVVPPDDFSLRAGDEVRITINGIGTLANSVVQSPGD